LDHDFGLLNHSRLESRPDEGLVLGLDDWPELLLESICRAVEVELVSFIIQNAIVLPIDALNVLQSVHHACLVLKIHLLLEEAISRVLFFVFVFEKQVAVFIQLLAPLFLA